MKSNLLKLVTVMGALLAGVVFAESVYVADHGTGVFSFDVVNNEFVFRDQV